jgi:hypothetical protein
VCRDSAARAIHLPEGHCGLELAEWHAKVIESSSLHLRICVTSGHCCCMLHGACWPFLGGHNNATDWPVHSKGWCAETAVALTMPTAGQRLATAGKVHTHPIGWPQLAKFTLTQSAGHSWQSSHSPNRLATAGKVHTHTIGWPQLAKFTLTQSAGHSWQSSHSPNRLATAGKVHTHATTPSDTIQVLTCLHSIFV